jgi:hypothetical protein
MNIGRRTICETTWKTGFKFLWLFLFFAHGTNPIAIRNSAAVLEDDALCGKA